MTKAPEIAAVEAKASTSSFYTAMKVMPKAEREAMFAIYAFCRAVDDIADDGRGNRADRHAALDAWRTDLDTLFSGGKARAAYLIKPTAAYNLKKEDFLAVVDGMAMDVAEDIFAPDLKTLDLYCDRVASAVGRLAIKVFGMEEGPGEALAHSLGRALQLTNILRDLDEDAAINRLYLPKEYLKTAGITELTPMAVVSHPAVDRACRLLAKLAHQHYDEANSIMRAKPKGNLRAPRLMGLVYGEILALMEKKSWNVPRTRARIGKARLLTLFLRHGLVG
jgi:phytoene synthase